MSEEAKRARRRLNIYPGETSLVFTTDTARWYLESLKILNSTTGNRAIDSLIDRLERALETEKRLSAKQATIVRRGLV